MTTYVVHAGTGTIIDVSDGVFIIDIDDDVDLTDDEIVDTAEDRGVDLNTFLNDVQALVDSVAKVPLPDPPSIPLLDPSDNDY